jgi:hypothetical protein
MESLAGSISFLATRQRQDAWRGGGRVREEGVWAGRRSEARGGRFVVLRMALERDGLGWVVGELRKARAGGGSKRSATLEI